MRLGVCLLGLLLCTQASAQTLTETESIIVSNLTGLRVIQKYCKDDYIYSKENIVLLVKKLGVNIDEKKYRAEVKKKTKEFNDDFKEMGTKLCEPMYEAIGGQKMGGVMMKR